MWIIWDRRAGSPSYVPGNEHAHWTPTTRPWWVTTSAVHSSINRKGTK